MTKFVLNTITTKTTTITRIYPKEKIVELVRSVITTIINTL